MIAASKLPRCTTLGIFCCSGIMQSKWVLLCVRSLRRITHKLTHHSDAFSSLCSGPRGGCNTPIDAMALKLSLCPSGLSGWRLRLGKGRIWLREPAPGKVSALQTANVPACLRLRRNGFLYPRLETRTKEYKTCLRVQGCANPGTQCGILQADVVDNGERAKNASLENVLARIFC